MKDITAAQAAVLTADADCDSEFLEAVSKAETVIEAKSKAGRSNAEVVLEVKRLAFANRVASHFRVRGFKANFLDRGTEVVVLLDW